MPGARRTHSLACEMEKTHELVTTGSPEVLSIPCAMVLTAYNGLSPVIGLSCHRRRRDAKHRRQLDTSVEMSGPHDFAVRLKHRSSARRQSVHRIPRPTSVTIAIRPSCGDGMRGKLPVIWGCDQGRRMRQIGTTGKGGDAGPFQRFPKAPIGRMLGRRRLSIRRSRYDNCPDENLHLVALASFIPRAHRVESQGARGRNDLYRPLKRRPVRTDLPVH